MQLSNISSPKAAIWQSLVGFLTFLAGFLTSGMVFLGRQSPWQRLVKRMTRFFTKLDADGSYRALKEVCEKMGYGWKMSCTNQVGVRAWNWGWHPLCWVISDEFKAPLPPLQVTISTTDRRNNKLIFKVNLVEMESKILVDFRLSKVRGGSGWVVGAAGWCRGGDGGCRGCQPLSLPTQGDGLEFKRHFLKIKAKLSDIVSTQKVWLPGT